MTFKGQSLDQLCRLDSKRREVQIGDRVKVVHQDIRGVVVRLDGYKAVVLDDDRTDWTEPDEEGVLIFSLSDLMKEE